MSERAEREGRSVGAEAGPSPEARGGRVPWGLLGMVALVATVELLIARHDLGLVEISSLDWRMGGRRVVREARSAEILFLGDSQLKLGIAPRIVEARTGRRSYNLSLLWNVVPNDYFLLRRLLESAARPAALVLQFHPGLLEVGYEGDGPHARKLPELLGPRECWEMARSARDARLGGALLVGRLLSSYREREEIRRAIVESLGGRDPSTRTLNLFAMRNWAINRGAQIMSRNPNFLEAEVEKDQWRGLYQPWKPRRVNIAYVGRCLRLAERRGIPVYWVVPPFCPGLRDRREKAGVDAAYTRFARRMQGRFPAVTVLDARGANYPRTVFTDPVHLDRQGSTTLSADVADVLHDRLAAGHRGPRWIELPAYRDRTSDLPLEDVEQSRIALEARSVGRRL